MISKSQLANEESYSHICHLILNSSEIENLNSLSFVCDRSLIGLIKENYVTNRKAKYSSNLIERVDHRRYGGGYGLKNEWLLLLKNLTLFEGIRKIKRSDFVLIISSMRERRNLTYFLADNFLNRSFNYKISDHVYNDYHKYEIMNSLETILEYGLYKKSSSFDISPKDTIKGVLKSYQKSRDKVLTLLEKNYRDRI